MGESNDVLGVNFLPMHDICVIGYVKDVFIFTFVHTPITQLLMGTILLSFVFGNTSIRPVISN